ncbi:cytochrome P450 4F22 [Aplysia californica]|uniref:Cytochrome P450 4F22 n=1 Tax=Aplysia californica TaxID=6500 RepID=A0ABM0JVF0_APLCA|nr:cytochrome P450 4F22 [Aplysia californica]XP_005102457.1 cytochrome P450 4F22 [Aplysia californica]XP_005102458.1 cytochrome P450 4F22 [Aplysia californica]XP_035826712.1 cytochrome P450 4F22 [Aplysia californica]
MTSLSLYVVGALAIAASLVVVVKSIFWLVAYRKYLNRLKVFPYDPPNFIFGNLFQYPGPNDKGLAFQRDITRRYPRMFLTWLMQFPLIVVSHPDTVKVILKSSEPKGEPVYNLIRPWIGDGLLTSRGAKWSRNRRLLTPAFHFEILKNYVEVKNRCADDLVQKFQTAAERCASLRVFSDVTMFTLDVILRCAMSYTTNCQEIGEKHPYVQAVNDISKLLVDRFFMPWFYSDFLYFLTPMGRRMLKHCSFVHKVAEEIIETRKLKLEKESPVAGAKDNQHSKYMDFLDILLTAKDEEGKGLSAKEIRDEVDTFLFEGHDTTASAISWALYSIAEHAAVQRKIQEELDERFKGRDCSDVLWEDLSELPYLTKVIKESMRLHTPVPLIQRNLTKDTVVDNEVIPEGTTVSVVVYNCHHNPSVWEDSMKFDPERFSPENVQGRDSYAFIPFSAGPRNCIGQNFAMDEIKIILARLLSKFSIKLDPTHVVEKDESIVMRAKNDIKIFITARD